MEELFDRLEDVLNEIGANCKSTETQSALIFMFKALYKMREAEPANEAETSIPDGAWPCEVCGYISGSSSQNCEYCTTPRPS